MCSAKLLHGAAVRKNDHNYHDYYDHQYNDDNNDNDDYNHHHHDYDYDHHHNNNHYDNDGGLDIYYHHHLADMQRDVPACVLGTVLGGLYAEAMRHRNPIRKVLVGQRHVLREAAVLL